MAITRAYGESAHTLRGDARARLGGPRPRGTSTAHEESLARFTNSAFFGSHMPLDTEAHWDWRNPLNVIPATVLLVFLLALMAAIM